MSVNYRETVSNPVTLTPSPKTMTLSGLTHGITATSNQAVNVAASFGSMALSKLNAQISENTIVQPGFGSMTLTGQVTSVDFVPVQGDVTVDASTDSMTLTGLGTFTSSSGPLEADWNARISGPGVVWYHDFRSASEVDAFRWSLGIGNDPNDGVSASGRAQNTVEHKTDDGLTGGGCLEIIRYAGGNDGKDWWRPFSAFSSPGNGRASDDPAAGGSLTTYTWSPTQGGNETAAFGGDQYGPPSTGSWAGREFYLQMAMKLDSRRRDAGQSGGKILYVTRTEVSLTAQELVTYYKNSQTYAIYKAGSPEVPNDLTSVPHVWDQWATYLYRITPGDENVAETGIEVWRQAAGEAGYTKIFQTYTEAIDYNDGLTKAWNAIIASIYHNGISLPEFTQKYDQIIFSREPVAPRGIGNTELGAACAGLSSNQSTSFSADPKQTMSESTLEWQTDFHYDQIRGLIHLLGKPAGAGGWQHQIYDLNANTWSSVNMAGGNFGSMVGHIYGNSTIDPISGRVYLLPGNQNTVTYLGVPTRRLRWYDPATGNWTLGSNDFYGGALNDTSNGIAWHPHLYGNNDGGVVIDQQFRVIYWRASTDTGESVVQGASEAGTKEGEGLYWPEEDFIVVGGSEGKPLRRVTENNGATPSESLTSTPPITTSGQSRGTDVGLNTGFGSLHVHPGNPQKLLLLETAGSRAYTGTWNGSTISWSQIGNHPFTNPGMTPRVLCALRGLGCMWAVGNDGASAFSHLWRPPI